MEPIGRSDLEELEVLFVIGEEEVDFYSEIDRRARGLAGLLEEAFDLDERYVILTLTEDDVEDADGLINLIKETIEENLYS